MTDTLHSAGGDPPQNAVVHHEETDADLRGVVGFACVLATAIAVVMLSLVGMFFALKGREDREKQSRFPLSGPERRALPQTRFGSPVTGELPSAPQLDGLNLDPKPRAETGIEEKAGDGHITIEQAMRLVAEEYKPKGREPSPVRYDSGIIGTGGGSNSGQTLPEAKR